MTKIFFIGKGGAGKSTLSVLTGILLSAKGKTAIYSLDQAHNLGDILEEKLSDKPKTVKNNLLAAETSLDRWKKAYLREIKDTAQKAYSYFSAYNLTNYFDIFEYAPDIDELSMILAINDIITAGKTEFIIFDMPPTALTLSFIKSIERNKLWIEKLIDLRKKIHQKKQIISRIELGDKTIETDKILQKLLDLQNFYTLFSQQIAGSNFFIVKNPDITSNLEAQRIEQSLRSFGLANITHILNKAKECTAETCCFPFIDNLNIKQLTPDKVSNFTAFSRCIQRAIIH